MVGIRRRDFIARGAGAAGALVLGPAFLRDALAAPARAGESPYGALQPPNADNLMLPPGFSSRQIARGGQPVQGTAYPWHIFSDGQATFRTLDGGWILVSNSESLATTGAGASAIRFEPDGSIAAAYRILGGTNINCAGGPTPWGTWLSCEEHDGGMVWECDPAGVLPAQPRPAMGVFIHEAAAVDRVGQRVYMTEDDGEGGFYRFTPNSYPDLAAGVLEVAAVAADGSVRWLRVPNALSVDPPTREQVADMTRFDGGEGAWHAAGVVYFTTKGDKKVWAYDTAAGRMDVLFDRAAAADSSLNAVDNVTVSAFGEVFVCEDGGNMEIGLITPDRVVSPFLRLVGADHAKSEMTGVVFDPSGTRMYFGSQGAYALGLPRIDPLPSDRGPGAVYEVSGPFRLPPEGVAPGSVFGPPAGELRPHGPLAPGGGRRGLRARARRRIRRPLLLRRGLTVVVEVPEAGMLEVLLRTADLRRLPGKGGSSERPRAVTLARSRRRVRRAGRLRLRLRLRARARRRLRRRQRAVRATLTVALQGADAGVEALTRRVTIGPAQR